MLGLSISKLIIRIITLVIAFTVHEFSHAWTANSFGDQTPKNNGRLTLNPLVHLDLFGSLLLLIAGFGWAKPVPVDPYALNRHSPSAFMWVSLAGPLSNLLMAILAAIPIRLGLIQYQISTSNFIPTAYEFAIEFIIINLALMLFNLIPLAPLDGEKVLDFFLPQNLKQGWNKIKQYGPIILLGLIFVLPMIGIDLISMVLTPALSGLLRILIGGF
ncbi:MAG: site-2 protease family protein [Anaerolineaceae bacterium]|nr:site-2 protease family protein [Anaerolineaceae bacterium]